MRHFIPRRTKLLLNIRLWAEPETLCCPKKVLGIKRVCL